MKVLVLLLLCLALGGCVTFVDRSEFSVVGTGSTTSIRSPGHRVGEPLVVELDIPASWWKSRESACSSLKVEDFEPSGKSLVIDVYAWQFGSNLVSLVLDHPSIRNASLPLVGDRGLPARLVQRAYDPNSSSTGQSWPYDNESEKEKFGVLPMGLYAFFRQCIAAPDKAKQRIAIERSLAAVLDALPRGYQNELRFQFGVHQGLTKETKEETEPPLGILRVTANMSLIMTTPTQPIEKDGQPFSGVVQSQITAVQRATVFCDKPKDCGSESFNGLDFSLVLSLAGTNKISPERDKKYFVDYVDGAWWQMHPTTTNKRATLLPLGAYLLYPKDPPLENKGGTKYWPVPERPESSPVWIVLDYGQTMKSSSLYDELKNLMNVDSDGHNPKENCDKLQENDPITCKAFIGPTLVEARIKVYLNGTAQWVPVGSVVADVIAHDQPEPLVACPSLNSDEKGASMPWARMRLPTLYRTFGVRTSLAVAEPASAILCLPLVPGDRLTW